MILIGGYYHGRICKVKMYNMDTDVWSDGKSLPYGIFRHVTIVVYDDIYVISVSDSNGLIIN